MKAKFKGICSKTGAPINVGDEITVWQVVEHFTLDQVADFIEDTKKHFERVTA